MDLTTQTAPAPKALPNDTLAVTTLGHAAGASRWRTEAMRAHATPRLLIFTKGQGRITVAGRVRGLGPNNLIFLPAGTLYGIEFGTTGFAQLVTIPRAMASDWPEDVHHLRLRDVGTQKELAALLDQLEKELLSHEPFARRAAHHRLALIAVFVERQIVRTTPDDASTCTPAEHLVEAYAGLIARDFRLKLGVADYAARLGVTPTHLTRCCRQTCGRSALSLLRDRRMFEARRLLRNSRLPVSTISSDLGFSSPAYFTRAFQKLEGMTPTRFRARGPVSLS